MVMLSRLRRDKKGNISLLAALTIPLAMAGFAWGSESSYWFLQKSGLRFATDGAAITAANMYTRGLGESVIQAAIVKTLRDSGYTDALDVDISYPATPSGRMIVDASINATKYFSKVFWKGTARIAARTEVAFEQGDVCMLALNRTASQAFYMQGNPSATLNGCVAASNSSASDAMHFGGSAEMTAACLYSAGGISGLSHATTACATPKTNQAPIRDPFTGKTQPVWLGPCGNAPNTKNKGARVFINPGCYNGNLALKGAVTFNPGVYFISGTQIKINAQADIFGAGVTFILQNGASISVTGGPTINLSAPLTNSGAAYPGVLFWGSATNGQSHKISGNSDSSFQGVSYFPGDEVEFTGTSGMHTPCMRLMADTISMKGNAGVETNCVAKLGAYAATASGSLVIVN